MTDQELDDFLAENAMGWTLLRDPYENYWIAGGTGADAIEYWYDDWHPSVNIAQAIVVAEKVMIAKGGWRTWTMFGAPYRSEPYSARFSRPFIIVQGDTPARALSLATAKALGAEV